MPGMESIFHDLTMNQTKHDLKHGELEMKECSY